MKNLLTITIAFAVILSFGIPAKAAPAEDKNRDAIIKLTEPASSGSPWTTDITGFNDLTTSSRDEYFKVDGFTDKALPGDEPGTHWMALVDADGTTVSDVLKLWVSDVHGQDPSHVIFEMWSEGDQDFAAMKALLPLGYETLKEDGTLQSVEGYLFNDNSGKLQIYVLSPIDGNVPPTGEQTPDGGATVMLLGVACAGIASVRRIVK